jgi:hypothetical protein
MRPNQQGQSGHFLPEREQHDVTAEELQNTQSKGAVVQVVGAQREQGSSEHFLAPLSEHKQQTGGQQTSSTKQ